MSDFRIKKRINTDCLFTYAFFSPRRENINKNKPITSIFPIKICFYIFPFTFNKRQLLSPAGKHTFARVNRDQYM